MAWMGALTLMLRARDPRGSKRESMGGELELEGRWAGQGDPE